MNSMRKQMNHIPLSLKKLFDVRVVRVVCVSFLRGANLTRPWGVGLAFLLPCFLHSSAVVLAATTTDRSRGALTCTTNY